MKKLIWRALFILVPFLYSVYVSAQARKQNDCSTTCFSSEVTEVQKISASCTLYELDVRLTGDCAHALSHYSVAVPCGDIKNLWNSENWKQVIGTDPTTGLSGFKIDDISNFGEGLLKSFKVRFTVCSTSDACQDGLKCWQPTVAYKASTCVNYETVTASCKSLKASLQLSDVTCFGGSDGSLAVLVEDGQEPFKFKWSTQSTHESISGLAAGKYSVTVTDASGSELTLEGTIKQPEQINIVETIAPASCNGLADGSIRLEVSGGSAPYKISWNNNHEGEALNGLTGGRYIATVTDSKGCSASRIFTIQNVNTIDVSAVQLNPDCNTSNGAIDLSVTGGSTPYSFTWSNGATSDDIFDVASGLYTVTVTDSKGCIAQKAVLLRDDNTLSLAGTTHAAACSGEADGSINVNVSGGTAPYTYQWSNGVVTEDLAGLTPGFYSLKVIDSRGCSATISFNVATTTFHVPRTVVQPTCHGASNGSITLHEPVGGTSPYTYEWSTGHNGTSLTNLSGGAYSVIVTDANGCSRTFSINIIEPKEITASVSVSPTVCVDGTHAIDLSVAGGTAPYTYLWSHGATTEDVNGVTDGSYSVVITDANGCAVSREFVVERSGTPLSCLIVEPAIAPVCNTSNNTLMSSVTDADSYVWVLTSADAGWSITSVSGSAISYATGNANSAAIFTLLITKDGCTKSCTYIIAACTSANDGVKDAPGGEQPGGQEPGGENPGNDGNETCEECFLTDAEIIDISSGCRTYEMKISTNGLCQNDLSHWTLAIPCGTISNYSNSNGWNMQVGLDPTTGLNGLKVDNISSFGEEVGSFTVRFTLCETGACSLSGWSPSIAYKAGQCVSVQSVEMQQPVEMQEPVEVQEPVEASSPTPLVASSPISVYPNPFTDVIHFEWPATQQYFILDIIDQYGNIVMHVAEMAGINLPNRVTLDASGLPKGMYYYRLTIDGIMYSGKLSKQ